MAALLSASTVLRDLVDGPVRPLHAVDPSGRTWQLRDPTGRVVACLTPANAWRLPNAFVVDALPAADARVAAGDGALIIDGRRLQPRRWWRPARPVLTTLSAAPGAVEAVERRWRDDLGRGPGLTPYADDVVCGSVVALSAAGVGGELRASIAANDLERRTTAISAALLRLACAGWCIDEVAGYLAALDADAAGRPGADVAARRRRLAAVGHSSGRGLLSGVDAALGVRRDRDAA